MESEVSISTSEKVAFLRKPSSYPGHPEGVEVIETHHSWVFLSDLFVYKMKKPVKNESHDYSSVTGRLSNCLEELRLNRRLAKEIYLEVVPLTLDEAGRLRINGKGKVVDWLLKMKRIPAENMLDQSIKNRTVTPAEVDRAAIKLAKFYKNAPPVDLSYTQYRKHLEAEIDQCEAILLHPLPGLNHSMVQGIASDLRQFFTEGGELFKDRIRQKKIIEGHGDLRPEHICLRPRAQFIDCLEFSRELRILDPVDDLSYLSLDCDLLGASEIGERFFEIYAQVKNDPFPAGLKYFYKGVRAYVKARLAGIHCLEARYQDDPKWIQKTEAYLQEAQKSVHKLSL